MTDDIHRHLYIRLVCGCEKELILEQDETNGHQSYQRKKGSEDDTTALDPFNESLKRTLAHQLDGEHIKHRHATGIDRNLGCA